MKKLLLFAIAGLALVACDDDSSDNGGGTTTPTTKEKIVGSWMGDEIEVSQVVPGIIDTSETFDISYLNIEFNDDNTGSIDSMGVDPETFNWSLIGDDSMIFDGDTFMIETLTGTDFDFYLEEVEDLGGGFELTFTQTIMLTK
ncbi:MAG: hypothetical protein SchgKO_08400 [Schleiferiaceae bacterium]